MTLGIRRLHPRFVAEASGVELRKPIDDTTFAAIRAAFEEHSVLVFHDQRWSDEEQIAFTRRFGPLEETTTSIAQNRQVAPQIADLSNVDPEGGRMMSAEDRRMLDHKGNQLWHSDSSFKRVPAMASLLGLPDAGAADRVPGVRPHRDRAD